MAQGSKDHYPAYSKAERIADGTIHALGVILSIAAAVFLLTAINGGPSLFVVSAAIYCIGLVTIFATSALYHMTPWEEKRPMFRRWDYAAIFLMIAGTYTPLVALIGSGYSYVILAIVWAIALWGMVQKLFFWNRPSLRSTFLYLGLGWMFVLLAWPMFTTLPTICCWLVVGGGLTYSFGVIFHQWDGLKFSNPVWHAFVLVASAQFYAAIYIGLTGAIA